MPHVKRNSATSHGHPVLCYFEGLFLAFRNFTSYIRRLPHLAVAALNKHLIFQVVYAFTCKTWPNLITCCVFDWSLLLFYCLPLTDLTLFKECPFKNCHVVQSVCLVSPHRRCHVRTGLLKSLFRDFSVVSVCD